MTSVLVAILSLAVLGIPIALNADRRSRGAMLIGTAYLFGSGAMFFVLVALSVVHLRWTLLSVTLTALAVFCLATILIKRPDPLGPRASPPPKPHPFDLLTVVTLTGYALYATLASLWEWDFWAIWGLKAKTFLEAGGIDWRFLESRWNSFTHPDYPLLVPLNFDFVALAGGGWSDRWLGLLYVAWGIALLLIVRAIAARETSPFFAALLTLALAALSVSRYVGLAEGALIAFGSSGVLFIRAALLDDDAASWRNGALMLGLAANCKNEGLALLVAATIAVLLFARQSVVRLWPAYALAAPWLLLRATHALPTDIIGGSAMSRFFTRLPDAPRILAFIAARLYQPWFWLAILAGILIAPAAARHRERFVLLVTGIQLAFFIAAYFATPYEVQWHVLTSWPRLTRQIAVPITFVVFLMLANSLRRGQDAAHAEARSDE
jgi:hypothetical protein